MYGNNRVAEIMVDRKAMNLALLLPAYYRLIGGLAVG